MTDIEYSKVRVFVDKRSPTPLTTKCKKITVGPQGELRLQKIDGGVIVFAPGVWLCFDSGPLLIEKATTT